MPGQFTPVTTYSDGQVLTAALLNGSIIDLRDHMEPGYIDDVSSNTTNFRATTDPGEISSEVLPTTLLVEVKELRYAHYDVKHAIDPSISYWYETPSYAAASPNFIDVTKAPYNADPTGVADATTAFTSAIAAAASSGRGIYGRGTFSISKITITNGIPAFIIDGWLMDRGTNTNISTAEATVFPVGVVNTAGPNINSGTVVSDIVIQCKISLANGCRAGIIMDGGFNNVIQKCRIVGPNDTTVGQIAIIINAGCGNTIVKDNTIFFPTNNPTEYQQGIVGWGAIPTTEEYYTLGGYDNLTAVASPISNTRIYGNDIIGGSHGINMFGCQHVQVFGNRVHNQRDRGMEFFVKDTDVQVTNNVITQFKSSAVTSGCGMTRFLVANNICTTSIGTGESALQCYLGGREINFLNNYVDVKMPGANNAVNYGAYVGCDVSDVKISGNVFKGHRLAAVGVDSDWDLSLSGGPLITPGFYGRSNTGAIPYGATDDSFANMSNIVISNNDVHDGLNAISFGSLVAFTLNQVKTRTLHEVYIHNNVIHGNNMLYTLAMYEANSGSLSRLRYTNNIRINVDPASLLFPRGMAHFYLFTGNDFNDLMITGSSVTPDVIGHIKTVQCSTAGLITDFLHPMDGQEIMVRWDVNSGADHNASKIKLIGGVDIAVGSVTADSWSRFIYRSVWFEIARNF